MSRRVVLLALLMAGALWAQPKRVLYVTHSAGFRHGSIETSVQVLGGIAPGEIEVTPTEDLSRITADGLQSFDAVFFFTSGELDLSGEQKTALLDFVRSGKGFGGAHSGTDTLYSWPEYGELIGGWFDGHPWVQRVRVDVEDPSHPIVSHLAPGFEIEEEIYQHRNYSRGRVRVLMTLDQTSADMNAPGVNRSDRDFALAWVQPYGRGRVFYTALGHFDETWRDARFQQVLRNALLWLTGAIEAPANPRPSAQPRIGADNIDHAVGNAATLTPRGISPGTIFSVYGDNFTPGSESASVTPQPPRKLAGTMVLVNGQPAPVFYASPRQINALAPPALTGGPCRAPAGQCVQIDVVVPGLPMATAGVGIYERTPGVFTTTDNGDGTATVWTTGLGVLRQAGSLQETVWRPRVEINGVNAPVLFSGLAPGWLGLYQVNVSLPPGATPPFRARILE